MMEFENTILIQRPIEEVFAFVSDFENVPKWNYYVTHVRQISEGPLGEGTIYHQIRKNDQQDFTITDYKPNHAVAVETMPGSQPEFWRRLVFEPSGNGTRIKDQWRLDLGQNRLVERLAGGRVKAAVADNLGKLKELLETGQTRLQDGRTVKYNS